LEVEFDFDAEDGVLTVRSNEWYNSYSIELYDMRTGAQGPWLLVENSNDHRAEGSFAPVSPPWGDRLRRMILGEELARSTSATPFWKWPTNGEVETTYSADDPTRKGIDIIGEKGQPVYASREGQVVYSGTGLIGYGELIIIRHESDLLSAYGHNQVRLVNEGDTVRAGQEIGKMGESPDGRELVRFEVRVNGEPIDPLPLLPAR